MTARLARAMLRSDVGTHHSLATLTCVTALALAAGACDPTPKSAPRRAAPAGSVLAPPLLAPISARQLRALAQRHGARGVLVNVWASWCGSCKHELPLLDGLARRYRERGVLIVTASVDDESDLPAARKAYQDLALTLPTYFAPEDLDQFKVAMNPAWPGMLPASFLYDATGALRYTWGGEAFENELVPILDGFLEGRAIDGAARFGIAPGKTE